MQSLILKFIIISTLLSVFIKYGGKFLALEANTSNALIGILLPALIMGCLLSWRIFADN
jgi:hypothetical protein